MEREREEQGSTRPSRAKHLAKMSPKRDVSIQQSHVSWGNQSFREDLLKSFMFPPKVAKGPKVTLFQAMLPARLQEQVETSPFRKNGEWQVKDQEEASPRFWCFCVLASMLRGCTDSLSSLPGSCLPPGVPSFAFTCQPASRFSSRWEQRVPMGP